MVAILAAGHEVRHSVFRITTPEEVLLVWGDIVHVPSVQFAWPELTWEQDADQALARASRRRIFELACSPGTFVAGAHLDFPGIGRVARAGNAYDYGALT